MKSFAVAAAVALFASSAGGVSAFAPPHRQTPVHQTAAAEVSPSALYEYIPSGFTKESWKKFQAKEAQKKKKNLGRMGPKGFQSRSFQSFQEALERGEAAHLMPVS